MKRIMILVLLLATALLSTSCQNTGISTDIKETTAAPAASETEPEEIYYSASYIPDSDFEGYEFRMVTMNDDVCIADVEVENGEIFNDSFYKRNRLIEDRYNIKLTQSQANDWNKQADILKQSVLAASDDFDLIRLIMREAFSLLQNNLIASVDSLTYCDLTQPWYIKYINEELKIGDRYTLAYTDECLSTYMYTATLFYNKTLAEQYNIGNLYASVRDNSWTIDKYMETVELSCSDINGDGEYKIADDLIGYAGRWDTCTANYWVGGGMNTISRDSDNLPIFDVNENMISLLNKQFEFVNKESIYYDFWSDLVAGKTMDEVTEPFKSQHCFFFMDSIGTCQNLRDMNDDFGILPMPKYNETQESYYSNVCDGYINVVPFHASDLDRTSIVLESLAIETKNIVMPAYIETTIQTKGLRDTDSVDMLGIILDTRKIDLGVTVWMDPIRVAIVDNCFAKGKSDFASSIAQSQNKIDDTISKAIENLSGNN